MTRRRWYLQPPCSVQPGFWPFSLLLLTMSGATEEGHGPHSPGISPPPWQPPPWLSPVPPLLSDLLRWHGGSQELPLPLWSVIQPRDGEVTG